MKKYDKLFTVNPPGRQFKERINARVSTWELQEVYFVTGQYCQAKETLDGTLLDHNCKSG